MLRRYAVSCLAVALATGLKLLLGSILEQDSPFLLYFAAVVASALYGGSGPGIFAAVISAGAAAYLFLPPFYSFTIANPAVRLRLGVFFVETIFISGVCGALRSAKRRLEATRADLEAESRERQRLLSDTEDRRRAAEALARVEALIAQSLDPLAVEQQIVDSIRCLFDAERAALYTVDAESGGLGL